MSQSPTDAGDNSARGDANHPYRQSWRELNELLRQGASWSGNEANCCFLNLANGHFANISAVSGLDVHGDGRALAVTDWDHDGDLDLWLTNRTGPRVQMFDNRTASNNHFLSLLLKGDGRTCNRDAIGARVEVFVNDSSEDKLVRTLQAGNGFLSQSSKWLFFGLGPAQTIKLVQIQWPDGRRQDIPGLSVDRHYVIVQNRPQPERWSPPTPRPPVNVVHAAAETGKPRVTSLLQSPLPMPSLTFELSEGMKSLSDYSGRPLLLNIWASWCQSCVAELESLTRRQTTLRELDVEVIALSVDGLVSSNINDKDTQEILEQIGFPFSSGPASKSLIDILHLVHAQVFASPVELPVPTSFLIDRQGRLAGVYRGPVLIDRLVVDIQRLGETRSTYPFAGRWFSEPAPHHLATLAWRLFDHGFLHEAIGYVERNKSSMAGPEFVRLLAKQGTELYQLGDVPAAIRKFEEALQEDSKQLNALNNLAWILATHSDQRHRNGLRAVQLAERAVALSKRREPTVLATLAAAYAEVGRFQEAVETTDAAIELAHRGGNIQLQQSLGQQATQYDAERPYRTQKAEAVE